MPSGLQSASLADEQVETLKFLWGLTIAQYLVLGVQATLFVITVYILTSQGLRASKARIILLCIVFVMFANSLIAYSILSHGHMEFLESLSGDSTREDDDTSLRLTIVANSLLRLNVRPFRTPELLIVSHKT
ncbi:hypothetical protein PM082_009480 [Marasmius tenuissimus]|nr:hypothetical protein PM082_009480 [Marasmius tenuissimus]